MAWLLRNVVVAKLIHRPVFDRHVTVRRESPTMSEPDGASDETKKKSAKASKYQYGTLCPHVTMYGPSTVENLAPGKTMKWCTCGLSEKQPWCDGRHKSTGFKSMKWKVPDKPQTIYTICCCKHTKNPPYCDGTHVNLPALVEERQKNCANAHEQDMKMCTGCGWIPKW